MNQDMNLTDELNESIPQSELASLPKCFGFRDPNSSICDGCDIKRKCSSFQRLEGFDKAAASLEYILINSNLYDAYWEYEATLAERLLTTSTVSASLSTYEVNLTAFPPEKKIFVIKMLMDWTSTKDVRKAKEFIEHLPVTLAVYQTNDPNSVPEFLDLKRVLDSLNTDYEVMKISEPSKEVLAGLGEPLDLGWNPPIFFKLSVDGKAYQFVQNPEEAEIRIWRFPFVSKSSGKTYNISYKHEKGQYHLWCDCPAGKFRTAGTQSCKHVKELTTGLVMDSGVKGRITLPAFPFSISDAVCS